MPGCTTPTPCTDDDVSATFPDGKNAYTLGTCRDGTGPHTDDCAPSSSVKEYYCSGTACSSTAIACSFGDVCDGGKCVTPPCTDTDGKNAYTWNTCKDATGDHPDECIPSSSGSVKEYYCSGTSCSSTPIPCSSGDSCYSPGVCEYAGGGGGGGGGGTPTPSPTSGGPGGTPTPTPIPGACTDTDNKNYYVKGACTSSTTNGDDRCDSSTTLDEVYCDASNKCADEFVSCTCLNGACVGATPTPTPGWTPSAGGCSWLYTGFGVPVCSSGCPSSNPLQQFLCCESADGGGCEGRPGCVSYNPAIGETPCCTSYGYRTCSANQECNPTTGQCVDVCSNPSYSKYTDPYCSKCDHCNDGLLNCGEPTLDKCGVACTLKTPERFTVGGYGCAGAGPGRCASAGGTFIRLISCSYFCYGCVYECERIVDVFNKDSCYDGVQNCGESCLDGGTSCAVGTESGTSVEFDAEITSELSSPLFYVNPEILCYDYLDNDKDCITDCDDPDCSSLQVCQDTIQPNVTLEAPADGAVVWYPARITVKVYDDKRVDTSYIVVKKDGTELHKFSAGECTGVGTKAEPIVCTWAWPVTPAEMGARTLQAYAKDRRNNLGTSSPARITAGCLYTSDCTTRYGAKNYCSSHLCEKCVRDQDFYCPDLECLGVDLDCCSTTVICPSGLYCNLAKNTCYGKRGNFCSDQSDCSPETYCSTDAQVCVVKRFVSINPNFAKIKLGSRGVLDVTISDPVNRTGSYELSISGTGKYYARFFGTQNKLTVTLKPEEAKTIPLYFGAGSAGQFRVEVSAVDTVFYKDGGAIPAGIRSVPSSASVVVETETKMPFIVSAPGPAIPELLAVALLASLFISYGGRR